MRRPRSSPLLTLISVGLLAVACGATEPLPSATPTSNGAAASASSPGGSTSGLSAFEAHLRDATATEGRLVRDLAAASSGTAADLRLVVGRMRAWADDGRAWLAANAADPCFQAAAEKLTASVEAMSHAADGFEGSVSVSLPPSDDVTRPSMAAEAANDLQDATQALIDAAALAKAARASCG